MCTNSLLARLAPVLLCGVALPAVAAGTDLQIHGFAAQGLVISKGNNVNGDSTGKGGSSDFRELGVNFSYRPQGSLLLAAQMAAVEAGKAIDEAPVLEYGLLDYTALSGESGRLGLRAGKLKLPIGLYNDSRDAVFTRPSILLPQGIYLETSGARAFGYFSLEGAGLYGDVYAGEHAVYAELVAVTPQSLGDAADIAILRSPATGRFEVDRGLVMRVADDYDGGRFRAAASLLTTTLQYKASGAPFNPTTNPFDQDGELDFGQAVLSLQYNWPSLTLTAEYVRRDFKLDDLLSPPIPQADSTTHLKPTGVYLQGTYRVTPKWSGLLRYDEQIRDGQDRSGREQSARFGKPRHYYFAHDWTAGTRYDLSSSVSLWAEFHYVDGAAWVNPLDNPGFSTGGAERYWNLFTVMAALRF